MKICDLQAFCRIIDDSVKEIADLKILVEDGSCIAQLGQKADQICNTVSEFINNNALLRI